MGDVPDERAEFRTWLKERGLETYHEKGGGMTRLLLYETFCEETADSSRGPDIVSLRPHERVNR